MQLHAVSTRESTCQLPSTQSSEGPSETLQQLS
jgi:hypothetical protein